MRPQGSPVELERRRLRAIALLEQGLQPVVIAQMIGVDRRSIRRWKRTYLRHGRTGVRARPAPGRPPKLTERQRQTLARWILRGPEAFGYPTALWTCRRIVALIRDRFRVVYHPDHVGRLLRACGFTPQRPQRTAKERLDQRVRLWVQQDWARAKKKVLQAKPG